LEEEDMKVQVWGSKGMLGSRVVEAIAMAGHTVYPEIERIEHANVSRMTGDPEVIVNCAGLVKQRRAFAWTTFMMSNAVGPHNLALQADMLGIRLIHVSTDCVFQGKGPHYEGQPSDAEDVYAVSKKAGEVGYGAHLTIRTSFVGFGTRGLLHDLSHKEVVQVSQNLLWNGHTVDTIAQLIVELIKKPYVTGILHVPGTDQNRYTLARDLKARWGLKAKLVRNDDFEADRRLYSIRWCQLDLPTLPDFETQLETMRGPQ
jgi:dTDP-4-dehydrorhamnose reductase